MAVMLQVAEAAVVNESADGFDLLPDTTPLLDGGWVTVWYSASSLAAGEDTDLLGQRYDASGQAVGGAFQVAASRAGGQTDARVAGLADGGFVVTWTDDSGLGGDFSGAGIKAQVFSASGARVGGEMLVNTATDDDQSSPKIAALADGGFVVAWASSSGSVQDVRFQVFNASGGRVGGERIETNADDPISVQSSPVVAALPNGGFVMTWTDRRTSGGDPNQDGIRYGVYNSAGASNGVSDPRVNDLITTGDQENPVVAVLANGGFVIAWADSSQGNSARDIRYRVFGADGRPVGSEQAAHGFSVDDRYFPTVSATDDGGFVIAWVEQIANGVGSADDVYNSIAQRFTAAGTPEGPEFFQASGPGVELSVDTTTLANGDVLFGITRYSTPDTSDPTLTVTSETVRWAIFEDIAATIGVDLVIGTSGRDRVLLREGDDTAYGGAARDWLDGADGADYLSGDGGDDLLFGGDGVDSLLGGEGDDTLDLSGFDFTDGPDAGNGGDGRDTVTYARAGSPIIAALETGGSAGEASGDTYVGVENLTGSAFSDTLRGDAGVNVLRGGDGMDVLIGAGGADELRGEGGEDIASYEFAAAAVLADMTAPQLGTGDAAGDRFFSIETLTGSAFGDTLRGDQGSQTLGGAAGDDVLEGRGGGDNLFGGDGNDSANYGTSSAAVTVDLQAVASNTGDAAGDIYSSIEGVLGTRLNDTLRGDSAANTLIGRDGQDVLQGRGGIDKLFGDAGADLIFGDDGDDSLDGGAGGDTLVGGAGADTLAGREGADVLDGGAGADLADYRDKTLAVIAALNGAADVQVRVGGVVEDTIRNIERLYGGAAADALTGDAVANVLSGYGGKDSLRGGGGADQLIGGTGNDFADFRDKTVAVVLTLAGVTNVTALIGGAPEDTLREIENVRGGTAGDTLTGDLLVNLLYGEGGNDILRGSGGADLLTGGAGEDAFRYTGLSDSTVAAAGRDTIADFVAGTDEIRLSEIDANSVVAGDQAFVLGALASGQAGRLSVTANGANSWLVQGDVTGDGAADFAIVVNGAVAPGAGDFVF